LQSVIFPFERGYSYNDNALKFTEDEENDWHSFQFLECSWKTIQHGTMLSRFVECWVLISSWPGQKKS